MPVPIKPIPDKRRDDKYVIDYSFLGSPIEQVEPSKKKVMASNKDAKLLFDLWAKAEKAGDDTFKIDTSIDPKDIIRLKTRGFLTGGIKEVALTNKGKTIVTTMALHEPNKFETKREEKSYNEILASMDKRGKQGYRIPKFATNNNNNLRLG
jgi:hypothetical protein